MLPRKGRRGRKGNQPSKCKARAEPLPVISSSDDEEWPHYTAVWEKLSALKRERAEARAIMGPTEVHRSHRESKVHRLAEWGGGILILREWGTLCSLALLF